MPTNEVYNEVHTLYVAQAQAEASGDPVVFGKIPGVSQTTISGAGNIVMQTEGVFNLSVKGVDGTGNKAINAGDIIYFVLGDTPQLNVKDAAGVRFGYALEAVGSGSTATIKVKVGY